jgi:UDP-N-acetyl-D-glucosamine dehydrogenase
MRRCDFQMRSVPLTAQSLKSYDCPLIATHHAAYDWQMIVDNSQLIIDTRNATRDVRGERAHIVQA